MSERVTRVLSPLLLLTHVGVKLLSKEVLSVLAHAGNPFGRLE